MLKIALLGGISIAFMNAAQAADSTQDELHGRYDRAWGTRKIAYYVDSDLQTRK